MNKAQEARILSNQALIMKALADLMKKSYNALGYDLEIRARDTESFIDRYLK